MVIAALASFALLLIAWLAAPSGVVTANKAPSAEMDAQPVLSKAA